MSGLSIALGFVCIKCLRHSAPAEDAASWKGQLTPSSLLWAPGTHTLLRGGCLGMKGHVPLG